MPGDVSDDAALRAGSVKGLAFASGWNHEHVKIHVEVATVLAANGGVPTQSARHYLRAPTLNSTSGSLDRLRFDLRLG
jgi:hypothetical protein